NAGQGVGARGLSRVTRGGSDLLVFPLDRLPFFLGRCLRLTFGAGTVAARRAIPAAFATAARLVGARPDPLQHIGELLLGRVDDSGVLPLERLADALDARLDLLAIVLGDLVAQILHQPLGLEGEGIGLVAGLRLAAAL